MRATSFRLYFTLRFFFCFYIKVLWICVFKFSNILSILFLEKRKRKSTSLIYTLQCLSRDPFQMPLFLSCQSIRVWIQLCSVAQNGAWERQVGQVEQTSVGTERRGCEACAKHGAEEDGGWDREEQRKHIRTRDNLAKLGQRRMCSGAKRSGHEVPRTVVDRQQAKYQGI